MEELMGPSGSFFSEQSSYLPEQESLGRVEF